MFAQQTLKRNLKTASKIGLYADITNWGERWSVIGDQWSVVGGRWSVIGERWPVNSVVYVATQRQHMCEAKQALASCRACRANGGL